MICYAAIDTNVLVSALLSSHDDAATVQVCMGILNGLFKSRDKPQNSIVEKNSPFFQSSS